jgi:hypothetical protein
VSAVRIWYPSQCVLSSVGDDCVPRTTSPLNLYLIHHKRRSVVGLEGFEPLTHGLGMLDELGYLVDFAARLATLSYRKALSGRSSFADFVLAELCLATAGVPVLTALDVAHYEPLR